MATPNEAGREFSVSSRDDEFTGRHQHIEAIYWDAQKRIQDERKRLPTSAYEGGITDLGQLRRIWDFYTPGVPPLFVALSAVQGATCMGFEATMHLAMEHMSRVCLLHARRLQLPTA